MRIFFKKQHLGPTLAQFTLHAHPWVGVGPRQFVRARCLLCCGFENPPWWKSEVPRLHEGRSEACCIWGYLTEAVQFGEKWGDEASSVFKWLQSHPLRCPGGGAGGCWPSIRAKVLDFLQGQWGATEG